MAFQQGLSGLNTSSKAIDVTSHNVANASTVGFKSGSVVFGDLYAAAMSGSAPSPAGSQIGSGSAVNAVRQAFTQGNRTTSSNPLDMAVNGVGFFRMVRTDGTIAYSRNGQFIKDENGFISNATGDKLTGYAVISQGNGQTLFAGEPSVIHIDTSNVSPRATTQSSFVMNLDSREVNPLEKTPPGSDITGFLGPSGTPANPVIIPPDSYNYTTSLNVFDSLGNMTQLQVYMVRDPATGTPPVSPNTWQVYGRLSSDVVPDPANPNISTGAPLELLGPLTFTEFGVLDTAVAGNGEYTLTRTAAQLGTGAADLTFTVDMTKATQWNSSSAVVSNNQDGYTTGRLVGMSVDNNGILQGRYSNNQTKDIAKIALVDFENPHGLISLGDNMWAESSISGQPIVGAPSTGNFGAVNSSMVEESNVDLTQELVNLIIYQRNYQANAQSIKTQDSILQTLVNLR